MLNELLVDYLIQGFSSGIFPATPPHSSDWLAQARVYIEDNHKNPHFNLDELSTHIDRSPRTIQKAFKQTYDISPIAFLHQQRIRTATRLLKNNPEIKITYLMQLCGYQNRSMFYRMFKRHTGENPSNYRDH